MSSRIFLNFVSKPKNLVLDKKIYFDQSNISKYFRASLHVLNYRYRVDSLSKINVLNLFQIKFIHNQLVSSILIESTYKKMISSYTDSIEFINHLMKERSKILLIMNDEKELTTHANKQDLFMRLNYLNNIAALFEKIKRNTKDIDELTQMLNNTNTGSDMSSENQEMQKAIQSDLIDLNKLLDIDKYKMMQSLIPEEKEDKEDAVLDLRF
jgi:hypothetical protein